MSETTEIILYEASLKRSLSKGLFVDGVLDNGMNADIEIVSWLQPKAITLMPIIGWNEENRSEDENVKSDTTYTVNLKLNEAKVLVDLELIEDADTE